MTIHLKWENCCRWESDLESREEFSLHIMHLVMLERQSLALGREGRTGMWEWLTKDTKKALRLEAITQRASVDRIALWPSPPGVPSGISCP